MIKPRFNFRHQLVAAIPLLLTPVIIVVLAEGILDFGGGEKDIVLALPYFIWALIFLIAATVLVVKRWPLGRWLKLAFLVSLCSMLSIWALAWIASSSGIL